MVLARIFGCTVAALSLVVGAVMATTDRVETDSIAIVMMPALPDDARVAKWHVGQGEKVIKGQVLLEFSSNSVESTVKYLEGHMKALQYDIDDVYDPETYPMADPEELPTIAKLLSLKMEARSRHKHELSELLNVRAPEDGWFWKETFFAQGTKPKLPYGELIGIVSLTDSCEKLIREGTESTVPEVKQLTNEVFLMSDRSISNRWKIR